MDVSVIIVTRNTRAMTCAAIRSVLDTDDSFAKEITVEVFYAKTLKGGRDVLHDYNSLIYIFLASPSDGESTLRR